MGSETRMIPQPDGGRVETGPVQFGDDWPGYFIRGDHCAAVALALPELRTLVEREEPSRRLALSSALSIIAGAASAILTRAAPPGEEPGDG